MSGTFVSTPTQQESIIESPREPVHSTTQEEDEKRRIQRRNAISDPSNNGYSRRSLFLFSYDHPIRRKCLQVVKSPYFDHFIILAIILNSIILALTDYSVIGSDGSPAYNGLQFNAKISTMEKKTSMSNFIVDMSEYPFTVIFTIESIVKIIAQGCWRGPRAYLRDTWNMLDFTVVLSSLIAILPRVPNVSAIRTLRVLRPLRSLSIIPGMRRLITALLKSLPALGNVVILQIFVFFIFGILGIQLFGGRMSGRCRLTPYPIQLQYNNATEVYLWPVSDSYLSMVLENPSEFQCQPGTFLLDIADEIGTDNITKEKSPWRNPKPCFWPEDNTIINVCAPRDSYGAFHCPANRTCGSNYDRFGNPRFEDSRVMDFAMFSESFNWGYTNFNNIGKAFFTIFQSITQEGWTFIMYMVMDSTNPLLATVFFIILMIFASFFLMNLTLAVISEEFQVDSSETEYVTDLDKTKENILNTNNLSPNKLPKSQPSRIVCIVEHPLFSFFITLVTFINTFVLSLDHHPMPPTLNRNLEVVNFISSLIYFLEMVLKINAFGLHYYTEDKLHSFDAFVTIMSILEVIAVPPSFISNEQPQKGAFAALRLLRMFRVFKLARNWYSLRELLAMMVRAVTSIANFAVLLFLFIYIYALVGLQFFANTFRFDKHGYPISPNEEGFWEADVPRNNFDSLLWSLVTVFQVITGESWNTIMYDGIRANGIFAAVYFISLVVMGNFILMNLFLALLLDNFSVSDDLASRQSDRDIRNEVRRISILTSSVKIAPILENRTEYHQAYNENPAITSNYNNNEGSKLESCAKENIASQPTIDVNDNSQAIEKNVLISSNSTPEACVLTDNFISDSQENIKDINFPANAELAGSKPFIDVQIGAIQISGLKRSEENQNGDQKVNNEVTNELSAPSELLPSQNLTERFYQKNDNQQLEDNQDVNIVQPKIIKPVPPGRTSLYIFQQNSWFRQKAYDIAVNTLFDRLVLIMIVISSVSLAVDNPLRDPDDLISQMLRILDTTFAIAFFGEMILKIVALGFIAHHGSYMRNNWNVIDFVIVISSILMIIADLFGRDSSQLKSLRSIRGIRTLRPLRMISRRPGLKLVVNALFKAIPSVLNVLFVCSSFYLIFAIVAVNYLKGTFNACSGDVFDSLSKDQVKFLTNPQDWIELNATQQEWFTNTDCYKFANLNSSLTSKYICNCWGATWGEVLPQNFDNVGMAILTFIEISTTEGWADVMMAAVDATEVDMQPIRGYNIYWVYFFMAFMMVGSFFVVNLLVGVIIDNFNRMKADEGKDCLHTLEQKKWVKTQQAASLIGPVRVIKPPQNSIRRFFYYLVKKDKFEWFIMICIVINTFSMATQYYGESTLKAVILDIINEIFAIIFSIEAILKIIAYGKEYFEVGWNQFDFFVVLGTWISLFIEALTGTSVRSLAMLVRIFRVTRIVRLIKASKSIRQIFHTLYIAAPGLSNITSILFLMLFLYTTMGVQLFATVGYTGEVDSHANFRDFWTGMLFLLRASTGEAWNSCMHDLARQPVGCDADPKYDNQTCGYNDFEGCKRLNGCGTPASYIYFVSFTLIITYVMLNLTIAVILEGFSLSHEDEEPLYEPELFEEFQLKWGEIDPKATGFIPVNKLTTLVNIIEPPLGRCGMNLSKHRFIAYVCGLDVHIYEDNTVHFSDVLFAMTREMVKELVAPDFANYENHDNSVLTPMESSRKRSPFQAHEYFAIIMLQRSVIAWLRARRQLIEDNTDECKEISKPATCRSKKSRDARVYTIG